MIRWRGLSTQMSQSNQFVEWLLDEVRTRGMNYSEVARKGGISHARISQVLSGEKPGRRFCQAIARAFNLRAEEVYRRAGLLPPVPHEIARLEDALWLFGRLPPDDQERIVWMMRGLAELRGLDVSEVDKLLLGGDEPPAEDEEEKE